MPAGYQPYNPIYNLIENIMAGESSAPWFMEWEKERALEDQKKFAERMKGNEIDEKYPNLDPRERMLLEYELSKGGRQSPAPPGVTPAQPPAPQKSNVQVPVPPRGGASGYLGRYDSSPDYIEQKAPVREPWEAEHEENFARFKEMNPNLDWAAVAEQSGGNVPGGTLSVTDNDFWDDPSHPQSNQAYYDWVEKSTYDQAMSSKLDPRSRAYDPKGAELLMNERGQRDANSAQMLYSIAQQQRAQAELDNVELVRKKMMMQDSPRGQVGTLIGALMESTDPTIDAPTRQALRDAMVLNALGKTDEAMEILRSLEQAGSSAATAANKTGKPQFVG